MAPVRKAKAERDRLRAEIAEKKVELRAAEAQMRAVRAREPFVKRLVGDIVDRRLDNHLARDFEITLTPGRRHA